MDNPFSWDYMTTVPGPNEVWGTFSIIYVVLFLVVLIASIAILADWARPLFSDVVLFRMAKRWANWGLGISIVALMFFVVRWLQINPFSFGMRLWMWLSLAALLALVIYMIYDYQKHHATLTAEYESRKVKEQYLTQQGMRSKQGGHKIQAPPPRPVRRRR